MIRCGELCETCIGKCSHDYTNGTTLIQCVACEGTDDRCEECGGSGHAEVAQCPMQFVGSELIDAVNVAAMCGKGDWPVAGGLLDQSAWFLDFQQRLKHETQTIESDRAKRRGT